MLAKGRQVKKRKPAERRGVGRPSKLTAAIKAKFIAALQVGAYVEDAASFAGIHKGTAFAWLQKGRESSTTNEFSEFYDAVELAQSEAIMQDLSVIARAAKAGNANAAEWRLEHRHPKKYGTRVTAVVEEEQDEALKRLEEKLSPEEYAKVIDIIAG